MARWEPNASQRLADAALELFAERGYDNTTVLDIAQRAGLGKSTFFRHFQNKREVLFGEDALTEQLVTAIAAAPTGATPLETVARGIDALGQNVFTPAHRAFSIRRRAVIEAHPDLQEREALKGISLTASVAQAIARRGIPVLTARVTAELSTLALKVTYERWSDVDNTDEYRDIARQTLSEVQAAVSAV
ncbi:TetR/AcrR family transcriptional regulator [Streptantibioticus ferralitis]|uniref:Helix-turn-helix domain containing protein n=1 Tax=Streptantibioticus ferralitis TaxID=236510 RepID=A0ABT5ZBE4_9ACTN|nr:TetR/AcrR family transcriptional regulator [Streptantibioticus ferralitis]MDF2261003.1 helix-turn-helix domain containing protein [Streptantibioticus ferralitis]